MPRGESPGQYLASRGSRSQLGSTSTAGVRVSFRMLHHLPGQLVWRGREKRARVAKTDDSAEAALRPAGRAGGHGLPEQRKHSCREAVGDRGDGVRWRVNHTVLTSQGVSFDLPCRATAVEEARELDSSLRPSRCCGAIQKAICDTAPEGGENWGGYHSIFCATFAVNRQDGRAQLHAR